MTSIVVQMAVGATLGLAISLGASHCASAETAGQTAAPPQIVLGQPDMTLAPAGAYAIDPAHTSVVARVSHLGYSFSVFRFGKVDGTLQWDPLHPEHSKLAATVQTASIQTPVPGFAEELAGEQYLNCKVHPTADFAAESFQRFDATHGKVTGDFTLLGKTKQVSFDAELVGAGPGFFGHPRLGIHAEGPIDPQDFGLPAMFGHRVTLVIDAEFQKS